MKDSIEKLLFLNDFKSKYAESVTQEIDAMIMFDYLSKINTCIDELLEMNGSTCGIDALDKQQLHN
jgi:hypothetical protein